MSDFCMFRIVAGWALSMFLIGGALAAEPTPKSVSPLADALQVQDVETARDLIERGADVNSTQVDGMTPLHWAVYHDDVEITRRLLAAKADPNAANLYDVPPIWTACRNGNATIVSSLLHAGANPNATVRGDETALMAASRTGIPEVVRQLIEHGADVNAKERKGQTAVMWAAAAGNAAVVRILIEAGADFQTPLKSGFTPLFFAVRQGHSDVVRQLLDAGIDVNQRMKPERRASNGPGEGTSPLILAIENGHFELAAMLLQAGADPNDRGPGYTPLHAITWVRKPIRGDGDPPPHGSGSVSSLELVRILVASGANVNATHGTHRPNRSALNRTDATPFLLASETADVPLMRLLIELGADPTIPNADHVTPLLAASGVGVLGDGDETAGTEEEAIEAVQLLLDLGADVNAVDDEGKTAMHGAAFKSWTKLVVFLADHGADVEVWNQKNDRGWTPLMIAQGHRPGNFRPSQPTIDAIELVMRRAGVEPPID